MRPVFSETDLNERPFLVFWEVTRACALACRHCRAVAQPRPHPDELTHEEALRLIDQLAELRPPMLVLTGGDPVMRPDILELIRAASGKGLHVAFNLSGTLTIQDLGLEEGGILPDITATVTKFDGMDYRSIASVPTEEEKKLVPVAEGAAIPETTVRTQENLVKLQKR